LTEDRGKEEDFTRSPSFQSNKRRPKKKGRRNDTG